MMTAQEFVYSVRPPVVIAAIFPGGIRGSGGNASPTIAARSLGSAKSFSNPGALSFHRSAGACSITDTIRCRYHVVSWRQRYASWLDFAVYSITIAGSPASTLVPCEL